MAARNPEWGATGGPPHVIFLTPGLRGGASQVVIDHNTILHNAGYLLLVGGSVTGLQYTNNIAPQGEYGVMGNGLQGQAVLDAFCPAYAFTQNAIVGGGNVVYPTGNGAPSTWNAVGFVNYQSNDTGNYLLLPGSAYAGLGANIASLSSALF